MLKYLSNYNNKYSLSIYFRKRRFKLFYDLLKTKTDCKILDIGGFGNTLEIIDKDFCNKNKITILNLENVEVSNMNIQFVLGDATESGLFSDKSFDVVYCNSVIEHVGDDEKRKVLSENIRKWGVRYFVQTPNYYFPYEPHFLIPFFHFFPVKLRAYLLNNFTLGSYRKESNLMSAIIKVSSVRLLNLEELRSFFPGAKIIKEKFFFLNKSFIAHNFD